MLLIEKDFRGGICHAIHRYSKASNKDMKDYDKNKEYSSYNYLDINKLCECAMS